MNELQTPSRQGLIMKLSMGLIILLLAVPLLVSWQYNLTHPVLFFLRAGAFLVFSLVLLWRLCLHIATPALRNSLAAVGVLLLAALSAGRVASFYFQGESFNEEFFFHFSIQTAGFAISAFPGLIALTLGYLTLVAAAGYFSIYRAPVISLANRTLLVPPALLLILVADPDVGRLAEYLMRDANTRGNLDLASIDWEATGLNQNALYRMSDEVVAGKNVVMIYLESMEQMYTDESVFPGLTPNMNALAEEGLVFDNIQQTQGTNFTVAGMVSSQCGTPLLIPPGPGGNDILRNGFLQDAICVGDILDAAGYRQVFMGGAPTRFAGKGVFLASHGYEEVLGLDELRPFMEDRDYLNRWGLYDDALLGLAAKRFDELASDTSQPFNFTVLTVDAHPPDGHPSASCEPYSEIENLIFHAVHCTDQMLGRFIDHLKQSPAWDNTVVFMMSDHLHMRNIGMDFYPPDYERKLYVNILNAGMSGRIDKQGTHMDLAPTLLSLMGVRHQQSFLAGNSLLVDDDAGQYDERFTPDRISAIRYINTNILSQLETGLCEADPLYSFTGGTTLRVAGREVNLTEQGRPMSLDRIGDSHVLITLVSQEGKVGLSFPVDMSYLAYSLYQFRQYNFFLLSPATAVRRLYPEVDDYAGLGVLFGNIQDGFRLLDAGLSFDDSFEVSADCDELLAFSRQLAPETLNFRLGQICDNTVPAGNRWDADGGLITLNSIAYRNNERYQVELRRQDNGWYTVTAFSPLDPAPDAGSCDAYYRSEKILIPGIDTAQGPASMTLLKIPGATLTFELDEINPFP